MPDRLTRRGVLAAGAGGVVAVAAGDEALDHRGGLHRLYDHVTGACGPDGPVPPRSAARVHRGVLRTDHLPGGRTDYRFSLPPGGAPTGLLVFLHGRGGQAADGFERRLRLPDVAAQQRAPLAVAAVSGGVGYWHRRADGRDPLALLLDEFLPFLDARLGRLRRVVMGVSMGGYGAALAGATRPRDFAGVVVSSGAFWTSRADQRRAVPDAFDSDADFSAHDVIAAARRGAYRGLPVRVDCGRADPFVGADRTFAAAVGAAPGTFPKGCHETGFWRRVAPAQVRWAAARLA